MAPGKDVDTLDDGGLLPATEAQTFAPGNQLGFLSESPEEVAVDDLDFDEMASSDGLAYLEDEWELVSEPDLVGVPFIIVGVNVVASDLSQEGRYFNVRVITPDGKRVCFNDGSTGVYRQLKSILMKDSNRGKPIAVKGGLRVSTYCYSEKERKVVPGKPNTATYYLTSSLGHVAKSREALAGIGVQVVGALAAASA
jgi:hypothetical protein